MVRIANSLVVPIGLVKQVSPSLSKTIRLSSQLILLRILLTEIRRFPVSLAFREVRALREVSSKIVVQSAGIYSRPIISIKHII